MKSIDTQKQEIEKQTVATSLIFINKYCLKSFLTFNFSIALFDES